MFKVIHETFNDLVSIVLKNNETNEYLRVIPEFGGNINELALQSNQNLIQVIDGYKNKKDFIENRGYKSVFLLPFANRVEDGKYLFQGREYQLAINRPKEQNAIHGFFHDKKCELVDSREQQNSAQITLEYNYTGTEKGYPFHFSLRIVYLFSEKGLECTLFFKNVSDSIIPCSLGWHPYFSLGTKIDSCFLKLPKLEKQALNSKLLPINITEKFDSFLDYKSLSSEQFDSLFTLSDSRISEVSVLSGDKKTNLCVWQEQEKYKNVILYIPQGRNSIAIEPMTSLTNAFNNETAIELKPNELFSGKFGVFLKNK